MNQYKDLEAIVQVHYVSLCAVATRLVGSQDIAQDIAQEVIIKFWENKTSSETITSIEGYLFTMVKNESLNYLRGAKREKERYQKLDIEEAEDPQILNILIEEETNQLLVEAINHLPIQSARIMRLVLSGYENKEIAKLLDVSINTIKTLKYGAIRKLREYFKQ